MTYNKTTTTKRATSAAPCRIRSQSALCSSRVLHFPSFPSRRCEQQQDFEDSEEALAICAEQWEEQEQACCSDSAFRRRERSRKREMLKQSQSTLSTRSQCNASTPYFTSPSSSCSFSASPSTSPDSTSLLLMSPPLSFSDRPSSASSSSVASSNSLSPRPVSISAPSSTVPPTIDSQSSEEVELSVALQECLLPTVLSATSASSASTVTACEPADKNQKGELHSTADSSAFSEYDDTPLFCSANGRILEAKAENMKDAQKRIHECATHFDSVRQYITQNHDLFLPSSSSFDSCSCSSSSAASFILSSSLSSVSSSCASIVASCSSSISSVSTAVPASSLSSSSFASTSSSALNAQTAPSSVSSSSCSSMTSLCASMSSSLSSSAPCQLPTDSGTHSTSLEKGADTTSAPSFSTSCWDDFDDEKLIRLLSQVEKTACMSKQQPAVKPVDSKSTIASSSSLFTSSSLFLSASSSSAVVTSFSSCSSSSTSLFSSPSSSLFSSSSSFRSSFVPLLSSRPSTTLKKKCNADEPAFSSSATDTSDSEMKDFAVGFVSGHGKKIAMSAASLEKARRLMESVDEVNEEKKIGFEMEKASFKPVKTIDTIIKSKEKRKEVIDSKEEKEQPSRSLAMPKAKTQERYDDDDASTVFDQPNFTGPVGFVSGLGKKLMPSASSLEKARLMMEKVEQENDTFDFGAKEQEKASGRSSLSSNFEENDLDDFKHSRYSSSSSLESSRRHDLVLRPSSSATPSSALETPSAWEHRNISSSSCFVSSRLCSSSSVLSTASSFSSPLYSLQPSFSSSSSVTKLTHLTTKHAFPESMHSSTPSSLLYASPSTSSSSLLSPCRTSDDSNSSTLSSLFTPSPPSVSLYSPSQHRRSNTHSYIPVASSRRSMPFLCSSSSSMVSTSTSSSSCSISPSFSSSPDLFIPHVKRKHAFSLFEDSGPPPPSSSSSVSTPCTSVSSSSSSVTDYSSSSFLSSSSSALEQSTTLLSTSTNSNPTKKRVFRNPRILNQQAFAQNVKL